MGIEKFFPPSLVPVLNNTRQTDMGRAGFDTEYVFQGRAKVSQRRERNKNMHILESSLFPINCLSFYATTQRKTPPSRDTAIRQLFPTTMRERDTRLYREWPPHLFADLCRPKFLSHYFFSSTPIGFNVSFPLSLHPSILAAPSTERGDIEIVLRKSLKGNPS